MDHPSLFFTRYSFPWLCLLLQTIQWLWALGKQLLPTVTKPAGCSCTRKKQVLKRSCSPGLCPMCLGFPIRSPPWPPHWVLRHHRHFHCRAAPSSGRAKRGEMLFMALQRAGAPCKQVISIMEQTLTAAPRHPRAPPPLQRGRSALVNGCWQREEMDFLMKWSKACYL